jgi:hypothetical protein
MFSFQLNHHMIEQKQKGSFYETWPRGFPVLTLDCSFHLYQWMIILLRSPGFCEMERWFDEQIPCFRIMIYYWSEIRMWATFGMLESIPSLNWRIRWNRRTTGLTELVIPNLGWSVEFESEGSGIRGKTIGASKEGSTGDCLIEMWAEEEKKGNDALEGKWCSFWLISDIHDFEQQFLILLRLLRISKQIHWWMHLWSILSEKAPLLPFSSFENRCPFCWVCDGTFGHSFQMWNASNHFNSPLLKIIRCWPIEIGCLICASEVKEYSLRINVIQSCFRVSFIYLRVTRKLFLATLVTTHMQTIIMMCHVLCISNHMRKNETADAVLQFLRRICDLKVPDESVSALIL